MPGGVECFYEFNLLHQGHSIQDYQLELREPYHVICGSGFMTIITVISGGMGGDMEQSFDPDRFSYTRITRDLTTEQAIARF